MEWITILTAFSFLTIPTRYFFKANCWLFCLHRLHLLPIVLNRLIFEDTFRLHPNTANKFNCYGTTLSFYLYTNHHKLTYPSYISFVLKLLLNCRCKTKHVILCINLLPRQSLAATALLNNIAYTTLLSQR